LAATIVVLAYSKHVIVTGEQIETPSGARYGYKIEQNYFRPKTTLSIWTSRGLNIHYGLYPYTVEEVVENRWLSAD
jgi:hypothetical protein